MALQFDVSVNVSFVPSASQGEECECCHDMIGERGWAMIADVNMYTTQLLAVFCDSCGQAAKQNFTDEWV